MRRFSASNSCRLVILIELLNIIGYDSSDTINTKFIGLNLNVLMIIQYAKICNIRSKFVDRKYRIKKHAKPY